MAHSPLEKIQALDAIEKEIILCLQSAGKNKQKGNIFKVRDRIQRHSFLQAKVSSNLVKKSRVRKLPKIIHSNSWSHLAPLNPSSPTRSIIWRKYRLVNLTRAPVMRVPVHYKWLGIESIMRAHEFENWKNRNRNISKQPTEPVSNHLELMAHQLHPLLQLHQQQAVG